MRWPLKVAVALLLINEFLKLITSFEFHCPYKSISADSTNLSFSEMIKDCENMEESVYGGQVLTRRRRFREYGFSQRGQQKHYKSQKIAPRLDAQGLQDLVCVEKGSVKVEYQQVIHDNLCWTLKSINVSCHNSTVLITGNVIRFSQFVDKEGHLMGHCQLGKFPSLLVFAEDTIYIDAGLNATGMELNMVLIAPKWEIVGEQFLNLDGAEAPQYAKASDGLTPGAWGSDGSPGRAGGPGGNFLGIGTNITDSGNLTISVRGGNGGKGQDAGNGAEGRHGTKEYFESYEEDAESPNMLARKIYKKGYKGSPGGRGGDGGKGGTYGIGGLSGDVYIFSSHWNDVEILKGNGGCGKNGNGGMGGGRGRGTETQICEWKTMWAVPILGKGVCRTTSHRDGDEGQDGSQGGIRAGREKRRFPRVTVNPKEAFDLYAQYFQNWEASFGPNFGRW